MNNNDKIYRVVLQHRYDGGAGADRVSDYDVLYCGYDRKEAVRVYYANQNKSTYHGPGNYYHRVVFQSVEASD